MSNTYQLPAKRAPALLPSLQEIEQAPPRQWPALQQQMKHALAQPGSPKQAAQLTAILFAEIPKRPKELEDPAVASAFTRAMIEELSSFPEVVLREARRRARRQFTFTPSIAEVVKLCCEIRGEFGRQCFALGQKLIEYDNSLREMNGYNHPGGICGPVYE